MRYRRRHPAGRRAAGARARRLRTDRSGDGLDAALRDGVSDDPVLDGPAHRSRRALIGRLERGEAKLDYDRERGYLDSLLAALEIDPASQTLVYSQTSLQSRLIGPRTPRAIYFNDDVYVGYVQDAPIEIASLDPKLGPVFYLLEQAEAAAPTFAAELGHCLSCHDSYSLTGGGVPRFIVGSGYTGTTGMLVSHEGWILISDRTPLKSRWGGWYVTGSTATKSTSATWSSRRCTTSTGSRSCASAMSTRSTRLFDVKPYLDEHERHRRAARAPASGRRAEPDHAPALRRAHGRGQARGAARGDGRALAAHDAVRRRRRVHGRRSRDAASSSSSSQAARVRDAQGRSLRDFDLTRRLFRYPLSYVIYSPAFDALPDDAKGIFYRRLNEVLTGADTSEDFAHLSAADRTAILEILRDTKPDAAAGVAH